MKMKREISDKLFAKGVCRSLFVLGLGDCWYETMDLTRAQKILYAIWMFISNAYLIIVVFSEVLANLRSDLTLKENNDCIQFSMAHTTVLGKFLVVYLNRFKIRKFYQRLIEDTRTSFSASSETAAVRKSKVYIGIVTLSMILCLSMTTVDGIMFHFREGIPVRTLVTYWPKNEDRGWFVSLARVATQFHWWYLIAVMVASDSVCITALIYLGFKFRSLRLFFLSLKRNFEENVHEKNQSELVDEYLEGFVKGIQLHDRILWCAKNLQTALGNVYSFQVVQSITLLSMCLIKLVSGDRSFTFILANTAFILCLLALTGTYMMAAGEITIEASLVPVCIFQSGWERGGARLRPLLVLSLMRSQAPVVMTAFGIFDLSYRNFISILRSSYSFFAVMY